MMQSSTSEIAAQSALRHGTEDVRLQMRFLLPLTATLVVRLLHQIKPRWFSRNLNSHGLLVANAQSDSVSDAD